MVRSVATTHHRRWSPDVAQHSRPRRGRWRATGPEWPTSSPMQVRPTAARRPIAPRPRPPRRRRPVAVGLLVVGLVLAGAAGGSAPAAGAGRGEADGAVEPELVRAAEVPAVVDPTGLERARATARANVDAARTNVERTGAALDAAQAALDALRRRDADVDAALERTRDQLAALGVAAYTTAGAEPSFGGAADLLDPSTVHDAPATERTVRIALAEAEAEHDRLVAERAEIAGALPRHGTRVATAERLLALARASLPVAEAAVEGVAAAGRALAAGAPVALTDFRFPVDAPHRYVDSWGFARSGGRRHQGTDVFAEHGAPAVAVESGTVERTGTNGLGGQVLWLEGDSGTTYYYAHLSGFAASAGQRVSAGSVVAFVGESGNAAGTGAHLHFEVHPGGGGPVNPYPLLAAAPLAADQPRQPGG